MKTKKSLLILALAVLMLALCALPALAGTYTELNGSQTGAGSNGIVNLKDYMTLETPNTAKPTVTYTFAVEGNQGNPWVVSKFGNTNGATGVPSITSGKHQAVYNGSEAYTTTGAITKTTAAKIIEFDFTGVKYKLPGVYYWKVTKTASNYQNNLATVSNNNLIQENSTTATAQTFYVYAIVTNKVNSGTLDDDQALQVTYGFYETNNHAGGADPQTPAKVEEIVDKYPASNRDLTLTKIVSGNQGDRTKAFTFAIKLIPTSSLVLPAGTEFDLVYSTQGGTDTTVDTNPTKIGVNDYAIVNLKHDQSVTIKDLPEGMGYQILEYDYTTEAQGGYTTTAAISTGGDTKTGDAGGATGTDIALAENTTFGASSNLKYWEMSDSFLKNTTTVTYTNTRTTTPPTGILLTVVPGLAIILLAGVGIAIVAAGRRRREEEQA